MSISKKLMTTGATGDTYVDDVFSTYLWKGNGGDRDIVNGVDLDGEGGMVWLKSRTGTKNHRMFDTERGVLGGYLTVNDDRVARYENNTLTAFNPDGFSLGSNTDINEAGQDFASWTFRKAPSFFDVVTYTGTGQTDHVVPHNLGTVPGMIIYKKLNATGYWGVWHRGDGTNTGSGMGPGFFSGMSLDRNKASAGMDPANYNPPTAADFHPYSVFDGNNVGTALNSEYVAYLFAHDDSDEGMIQCGSYTGNQTAGKQIDLGFEPQFVLIKASSGTGEWYMFDTMRGIVTGGFDPFLRANMSAVESGAYEQLEVNPTGFSLSADTNVNTNGVDYIYMAIRRPNKPLEEFEADELFGLTDTDQDNTAVQTSLNRIDLNIQRTLKSNYSFAQTRLQGNIRYLKTNENMSEGEYAANNPRGVFDTQGKIKSYSSDPAVTFSWMRAPGFFDVVTYEGDVLGDPSGYKRFIPHNLGVAPNMMWVKNRSSNNAWAIHHSDVPVDQVFRLNTYGAPWDDNENSVFGGTVPTESHFTVGWSEEVNGAGKDYIAYLFASVPGLCSIGSYTGTGNNQEIDCGFTNGARFVMVKLIGTADEGWMIFDTLRGISNADSPRLSLDSVTPQVQGSYIKPNPKGFTATSNLTGVSGREYIYMAIA